MPNSTPQSLDVAFLFIDGFALMSAAAAVEPLRAANGLAGAPLYRMHFLSRDGGWASSSSGGGFATTPLADLPARCRQVFVVAGGDPMAFADAGVFAALRALEARGTALGGISGGGVILARAGVMEGRRFTVHWEHFPALRALSDRFLLEKRLYVLDRDRATCAGGAAALDMMHALIATAHGAALARRVSDWFIHTHVRVADDPQRAELAAQHGVDHPTLIAAIGLMDSHIADPLSLGQLAALTDVSARQLGRLFQRRLGRGVMDFYRDVRLAKADELVRRTPLAIVDVGLAAGFSSPAHFARAYRARYGVAPRDARRGAASIA